MSIARARQLRRDATDPERAMWRLLYPLRQQHNFRRQVPLGPYYADFACHSLKLVIEIDGDTHGTATAEIYDAARTRFIQSQGYRVMRFTNHEVATNPDGAFTVVSAYLDNLPLAPPPQPSPRGGGSHTENDARSYGKNQPNSLPLVGRAGGGGRTGSNSDEDHK